MHARALAASLVLVALSICGSAQTSWDFVIVNRVRVTTRLKLAEPALCCRIAFVNTPVRRRSLGAVR